MKLKMSSSEETNITNKENEDDLETIKVWISKQPHLPQNIEDKLLCRFLHTCNNSLEKTKRLIDLFYTIRSQAPEIFANRNPNDKAISDIFKVIDLVPLPNLTKENYKLFIFRLNDKNPDNYNFVDVLKAFFMMSDTRMKCETTFHAGEVPIFDMDGFTLRHLTKVTLPVLKKYMLYTQEAHPIRLRQIHILNTAPILDRCLALVRPFMKSEVASMLHFHTPNSDTLYKYIPKDLLPEEYGGKCGKIHKLKAEWLQKVWDNADYFMDDTKWKVDENKRPIENENRKQLFGMAGSFRSLNID